MTSPRGIIPPEPGDFEVVPIGGTGGRLIHFAQWLNGDGFADYEHARLYLGDGKVVEAEPGGARIVPITPSDGGLWSTGLIVPTAAVRKKIVWTGYGCDGIGYSSMDYFALAAKRLHLDLITPGLRAYVKSSGHMICSQLVAYCYAAAGMPLFGDEFTGDVTPADLANLLLSKQPGKKPGGSSRGKHAL
jgi:cell wall-associated NlpC family hydrolase